MKEIRIHARAGQGAITAAMLLAVAAFEEGKFALAFPHFGAERMGAPMNAFVRLDDKPIRVRSQIRQPDCILVQDPTLLLSFNVIEGLKPDGLAIINTEKEPEALKLQTSSRIVTVPASRIAQELLGRADRTNTAVLGAFAAAGGEIGLKALKASIRARFSGAAAEKNIQAAEQAYEYVKGAGVKV
ncbi:MAG: 2-oxoacid:acceptor oxidoreductase family protein [Chloroflexi bacterium]|nr:2-oxoacid:acceptor oxidoreductase family protein [Chloroflexota bacterium]MCL5074889.1 2-oxoacid:acceptor oxidoreductase family protein [Chloroflexota bacterium]